MKGYGSYNQLWEAKNAEREAEQAEEIRQQEELVRLNAETRAKYLAGLKAKRAAKVKEKDDEFDAAYAGEKLTHKRAWMIDHPEYNGEYYEQHVWPMLRAQWVEKSNQDIVEANKRSFLASEGYAL